MSEATNLDTGLRERIEGLVGSNDVMLFMKGTRTQPQCGFSATVIRILDTLITEYQTIDVLSDQDLREGIKSYSSWPTIPQLYVKGEFLGGCDIIQELFQNGELAGELGVEIGEVSTPNLSLDAAAAQQLGAAVEQQGGPGRDLHLSIDARFQANLFIGPTGEDEIIAEASGIRFAMDPVTASRANGLSITVAETPEGAGFKIENPNAPQPPRVHPMSVSQLKQRLDAGEHFEFMDVRTPAEREQASIAGTKLMTQDEAERMEALPLDTMIVFHCHHGGRSQQAAEHFTALGFTQVHNVEGGIDAWAQEIDTSVPRY